MIKPNELRLGNYVNYDGVYENKNNYQPLGWEYFLIKGNGKEFDISPIPLTPEILINCGFKSDEKNIWFLGFMENFCIEYAEYLMEFNYYLFGYNYTQTQIKYLHQLQNLYFALTGKELEINL